MRSLIGFITVAYLLLNTDCEAQNYSVYDSYCLNPFLYNPAETATEFTYININHRMQWVGVEGAPKITTATFTTLIDETRTGLGFKASSFSRGLLKTNDLTISYAHSIPVNQKNAFYLGLAGGAISNNLDIADLDNDDPALANYLSDNFQPAAQFGMLYRSGSGINLGLSLPQLFNPQFNKTSNFDYTTFSPIDNVIFSAYYKRILEPKKFKRHGRGLRKGNQPDEIAPLELYAVYKYAKNGLSQAEGTVKLNLSQHFWLGGVYRQHTGAAGLVGFGVSNLLFNYAYAPGNQPADNFSSGSHEFHCRIRLGSKRKIRRITPVLQSRLHSTSTVKQQEARFQQSGDNLQEADQELKARHKYYVVIKSFADFSSADVMKRKLYQDRYNADLIYDEKTRKFHVFIFQTTKESEAYQEARNLKTYTKLKTARVVSILTSKSKQR